MLKPAVSAVKLIEKKTVSRHFHARKMTNGEMKREKRASVRKYFTAILQIGDFSTNFGTRFLTSSRTAVFSQLLQTVLVQTYLSLPFMVSISSALLHPNCIITTTAVIIWLALFSTNCTSFSALYCEVFSVSASTILSVQNRQWSPINVLSESCWTVSLRCHTCKTTVDKHNKTVAWIMDPSNKCSFFELVKRQKT